MSKMTKEEKEHLKRMNDTFLYELGYQHMNIICEETDRFVEENMDCEIPKSLDEWFYSFNKEYIEIQKKKKQKRDRKKRLIRFVAVILILLLCAGVMTLSVEAFRVSVFNLLLEKKDKYNEISYNEEKSEIDIKNILDVNEGYYMPIIPDGFELSEVREVGRTVYMTFDDNEYYFMFRQGSLELESKIDNENRDVYDVRVGDNDGVLFENSEEIILVWNNNESCFRIISDLDKNTVLEIAESLKKFQK